jgi:hypothetical protein
MYSEFFGKMCTDVMVQMLSVVLLSLIAAALGRPQLPADVSEAQCPNFPYCAPTAVDLSAFTPAQQVIGIDQRRLLLLVVLAAIFIR